MYNTKTYYPYPEANLSQLSNPQRLVRLFCISILSIWSARRLELTTADAPGQPTVSDKKNDCSQDDALSAEYSSTSKLRVFGTNVHWVNSYFLNLFQCILNLTLLCSTDNLCSDELCSFDYFPSSCLHLRTLRFYVCISVPSAITKCYAAKAHHASDLTNQTQPNQTIQDYFL